jgi:methionyl-tRNA formyltransferase
MTEAKKEVIFLGNGPLAEYALAVLAEECQILFVAHSKDDLEEVCQLKRENPEAHGVLASYGVIIPPSVLELFEPEGILNIHPSLLPKYRGASPIESAILNGDTEFGVSVMKLAQKMDAGPVYWQTTLSGTEIGEMSKTEVSEDGLPLDKPAIYQALAEAGAKWICEHLDNLPEPVAQDETDATYTEKMVKSMGALHPETESADEILRKIVAYAGYPKARYALFGKNCTILAAKKLKPDTRAVLPLKCADGQILALERIQPEGRKAMDAKSFLNGYGK